MMFFEALTAKMEHRESMSPTLEKAICVVSLCVMVVEGIEASLSSEVKELHIVEVFEFVGGLGGWVRCDVGSNGGVDIKVVDLQLFLLTFTVGSI
jgi:hypothetical protein